MFSVQLLYSPYLLNWVGPAVQADGPTQLAATGLAKRGSDHALKLPENTLWTITEISVKNGVWGPVEWVGDQLTGWGGSS